MRAAPLLLLAASAGAYETDEREAWESPTMATPGGIARFAPRTADSVCTGISQALPAAECAAWATIYDAYDLGNLKPRSCAGGRTNPCASATCVACTWTNKSYARVTGIDLGDRGLTGKLVDAFGDFEELTYLMLASNALTGPLPKLPFENYEDCGGSNYVTTTLHDAEGNGFQAQLLHPGPQNAENSTAYRDAWPKGECCYLDSAADSGVYNAFDCPLPEGAADYCNAECGNTPDPRPSTDDEGPGPPPGPPHSAPTRAPRDNETASLLAAATDTDLSGVLPRVDPAPLEALRDGADCNAACTTPSNATYPICDVETSLNFGDADLWAKNNIAAAYCTEQDLVVWSNGEPNHEVFLEEIPKPPGAPTDQSYPMGGDGQGVLRTWIHMSYAYRIPLQPKKASSITYYTGFGATWMAVNGMPAYPDDSTSGTSTKLDQQLDHCNEHAGKGADVHYHGNPGCMYNSSVPTLVGYAGDGYPVYGLIDPTTGKKQTNETGLDKCNGKTITFADGTSTYAYFNTLESPFTVTCWQGDPGDKWSNGHQWNYDNSMERTDGDLLKRCCK